MLYPSTTILSSYVLAFHHARTFFLREGWVETLPTDRIFFDLQCAVRETVFHMFLIFHYLSLMRATAVTYVTGETKAYTSLCNRTLSPEH